MTDKLPPKVLVIDTNETQCTITANTIERYFFSVEKLYAPEQVLKIAYSSNPNILVINSTDDHIILRNLVSNIRNNMRLSKLPIICLADQEQVKDSFVAKDDEMFEIIYRPFTPNEMLNSIKSLLRKSQPIFQDKIIRYRDISIDLATYTVYRKNKFIRLGPTEFKILQLFMRSPKSVFSRQQIIEYVWGTDKEIELRTVDVHVNRLRTILKMDKKEEPIIQTLRSRGYCLSLSRD